MFMTGPIIEKQRTGPFSNGGLNGNLPSQCLLSLLQGVLLLCHQLAMQNEAQQRTGKAPFLRGPTPRQHGIPAPRRHTT